VDDGNINQYPLGPGRRVQIVDIKSMPEKNDTFGILIEWREGKGRWEIAME